MTWVLLAMGLVSFLLLVPVSAQVMIATEDQVRVEILPRWGALNLSAWRSGTTSGRLPSRNAGSTREVRARNRRSISWKKLQALLASEDLLASLGRWLGRILRLVAPSEVRVYARFGVGDPYETARLATALAMLFALINRVTLVELELEPDFVDQVFAVEARACFRIVPLVLIATVFGYLFTPAPWRALGRYARA